MFPYETLIESVTAVVVIGMSLVFVYFAASRMGE